MPSGNYKVSVTLPNGTVITYTTVGAVDETTEPGLKKFTGRRLNEATDGIITVHKDKIVDQKVEPI
jgi:hypothetical protein